MASIPKPQFIASISKLPRNPSAAVSADQPNPNPSSIPAPIKTNHLAPSREDLALSRASHLTRAEVLRRRSRHLKRLSRCYREHYWALMEEVKVQYRHYYWKYGVSPFKEDNLAAAAQPEAAGENGLEGTGENNNSGNAGNRNDCVDGRSTNNRCLFVGCKLKAMALTRFCHLHILSDAKQKLYIPCSYIIKSAQAGNITCGKPILRSIQPTLCTVHFQKAQKHVTRALKRAGLNVNSSSKLAPKFHVLVAEYVRQIQFNRRSVLKEKNEVEAKEQGAG